jgi:hypothetical protein
MARTVWSANGANGLEREWRETVRKNEMNARTRETEDAKAEGGTGIGLAPWYNGGLERYITNILRRHGF